jgi:hypothetical protein
VGAYGVDDGARVIAYNESDIVVGVAELRVRPLEEATNPTAFCFLVATLPLDQASSYRFTVGDHVDSSMAAVDLIRPNPSLKAHTSRGAVEVRARA